MVALRKRRREEPWYHTCGQGEACVCARNNIADTAQTRHNNGRFARILVAEAQLTSQVGTKCRNSAIKVQYQRVTVPHGDSTDVAKPIDQGRACHALLI